MVPQSRPGPSLERQPRAPLSLSPHCLPVPLPLHSPTGWLAFDPSRLADLMTHLLRQPPRPQPAQHWQSRGGPSLLHPGPPASPPLQEGHCAPTAPARRDPQARPHRPTRTPGPSSWTPLAPAGCAPLRAVTLQLVSPGEGPACRAWHSPLPQPLACRVGPLRQHLASPPENRPWACPACPGSSLPPTPRPSVMPSTWSLTLVASWLHGLRGTRDWSPQLCALTLGRGPLCHRPSEPGEKGELD